MRGKRKKKKATKTSKKPWGTFQPINQHGCCCFAEFSKCMCVWGVYVESHQLSCDFLFLNALTHTPKISTANTKIIFHPNVSRRCLDRNKSQQHNGMLSKHISMLLANDFHNPLWGMFCVIKNNKDKLKRDHNYTKQRPSTSKHTVETQGDRKAKSRRMPKLLEPETAAGFIDTFFP